MHSPQPFDFLFGLYPTGESLGRISTTFGHFQILITTQRYDSEYVPNWHGKILNTVMNTVGKFRRRNILDRSVCLRIMTMSQGLYSKWFD